MWNRLKHKHTHTNPLILFFRFSLYFHDIIISFCVTTFVYESLQAESEIQERYRARTYSETYDHSCEQRVKLNTYMGGSVQKRTLQGSYKSKSLGNQK